jgi:hypothetical protein
LEAGKFEQESFELAIVIRLGHLTFGLAQGGYGQLEGVPTRAKFRGKGEFLFAEHQV